MNILTVVNLLVILSAVVLTFFQSAFYVFGTKTVEKVKKIKRVKIALKVCTAFWFNVFDATSILLGTFVILLSCFVQRACSSARYLFVGVDNNFMDFHVLCKTTLLAYPVKWGKLLHARDRCPID